MLCDMVIPSLVILMVRCCTGVESFKSKYLPKFKHHKETSGIDSHMIRIIDPSKSQNVAGFVKIDPNHTGTEIHFIILLLNIKA